MNNKKGFTLVELIAVIAILAVLVLVALPNVLGVFNKSIEEIMKIEEAQAVDAGTVYVRDNCGRTALNKDKRVACRALVEENKLANDEVYFCLKTVQGNGYIDEIKYKGNTRCDGIIVYKYNDDEVTFSKGKTYLSCENDLYLTKGYEKYKDKIEGCTGKQIQIAISEPTPTPEPNSPITPENTPSNDNVYKIILNNNGATTKGTETIYEKFGIGWYSDSSAINAITSIITPVKKGYRFNGYTKDNDNLIINNTGVILPNTAETFDKEGIIDAEYTARKFTVILNNNESKSENITPGTTHLFLKYGDGWYFDNDLTMPVIKITNPSNKGKTFKGFYTSLDDNATLVIDQNGNVKEGNNKLFANEAVDLGQLYAKWENNKYSLSFDCNGYGGEPSPQVVTFDKIFNLTNSKCNNRKGYEQDGWLQSGTNTKWDTSNSSNKIWSYDNDIILVPNWVGPKSYTVTFDCEGNGSNPASETVLFGSKYTLNSNKKCTKTGTSQNGWKDQNKTIWNSENTNNWTWNYDYNIVLTPIWNRGDEHYVTYDCNGGTNGPKKQVAYYGEEFLLPDTTCTREGYTQNWWYQNLENGKTSYWTKENTNDKGWKWNYNYDITLHAKWVANKYNVTYDCKGYGTNPSKNTATYGSTFTLSKSTCGERTGYTQDGWLDQRGVKWTTANTNNWTWNISYNPVLEVNWVPNTYEVTYNCDGGSGTPPKQTNIKFGSTYSINPALCQKPGYTQVYWTDQNNVVWSKENATNWIWSYTYSPKLTAKYVSCNRWVLTNPETYSVKDRQKQLYEFYRNCQKQTGWIYTTGGIWENPDSYLLNPDPYEMTDDATNKWYYFDTNTGYMINGWQYLPSGGSDNWYYFSTCVNTNAKIRCGMMNRNTTKYESNKVFKLNSNGACENCQNSWFQVYDNTNYYWYHTDNNAVPVKGWNKINDKWYYFDSTGKMKTGWILVGSDYYYLNTDGSMLTGWLQSGNKWYYLETDGKMVKGTTKTINGKSYTFNSDGACTSGDGC